MKCKTVSRPPFFTKSLAESEGRSEISFIPATRKWESYFRVTNELDRFSNQPIGHIRILGIGLELASN